MENESAWGYPLWDDLVPTLPPASRLYHLPPEGLGTPESESLTSYVVRLATAHRVSVRSLVVTEIRPQLGPTAERATYLNRLVMFWRRDSATLNGTSGTAQAWVRALQTLTARTDLAGLTMLHWAQVVAAVGLVRLTRVWCPACYHDQQQGSGTIYDLLLWALAPVTWCVQHRCRLVDRCPRCNCTQPTLAGHGRPGCCSHCGYWLGAPPDKTRPIEVEEATPWEWWLTQAVGSLVAAAPGAGPPPQRDQIAQVVNALMDRMPWGRGAPLARLMHLTESVVSAWSHGRQVPQLESMARLSACLGRLPAEMLAETDIPAMVWRTYMAECLAPPQRMRRSYQRRDWDAIQKAVESLHAAEETPPPALCEVGQRLGIAVSQLRVRFPLLCRVFSNRHQAYSHAQSQQRQADVIATVRQAVLQFHNSGQYPDLKRVAQTLPKPGLMRAPEARAAWQAMLTELGWPVSDSVQALARTGKMEA